MCSVQGNGTVVGKDVVDLGRAQLGNGHGSDGGAGIQHGDDVSCTQLGISSQFLSHRKGDGAIGCAEDIDVRQRCKLCSRQCSNIGAHVQHGDRISSRQLGVDGLGRGDRCQSNCIVVGIHGVHIGSSSQGGGVGSNDRTRIHHGHDVGSVQASVASSVELSPRQVQWHSRAASGFSAEFSDVGERSNFHISQGLQVGSRIDDGRTVGHASVASCTSASHVEHRSHLEARQVSRIEAAGQRGSAHAVEDSQVSHVGDVATSDVGHSQTNVATFGSRVSHQHLTLVRGASEVEQLAVQRLAVSCTHVGHGAVENDQLGSTGSRGCSGRQRTHQRRDDGGGGRAAQNRTQVVGQLAQVDHVVAATQCKVGNAVDDGVGRVGSVAVGAQEEGISTFATGQHIRAGSTEQLVVACTTNDGVITGVTHQHVSLVTTLDTSARAGEIDVSGALDARGCAGVEFLQRCTATCEGHGDVFGTGHNHLGQIGVAGDGDSVGARTGSSRAERGDVQGFNARCADVARSKRCCIGSRAQIDRHGVDGARQGGILDVGIQRTTTSRSRHGQRGVVLQVVDGVGVGTDAVDADAVDTASLGDIQSAICRCNRVLDADGFDVGHAASGEGGLQGCEVVGTHGISTFTAIHFVGGLQIGAKQDGVVALAALEVHIHGVDRVDGQVAGEGRSVDLAAGGCECGVGDGQVLVTRHNQLGHGVGGTRRAGDNQVGQVAGGAFGLDIDGFKTLRGSAALQLHSVTASSRTHHVVQRQAGCIGSAGKGTGVPVVVGHQTGSGHVLDGHGHVGSCDEVGGKAVRALLFNDGLDGAVGVAHVDVATDSGVTDFQNLDVLDSDRRILVGTDGQVQGVRTAEAVDHVTGVQRVGLWVAVDCGNDGVVTGGSLQIIHTLSERNSAVLTNPFISQRLTRVLKPSKRPFPTTFLPQKAYFQS